MQLVRNPKQFDVILTDNLFGDLLSDMCCNVNRITWECFHQHLIRSNINDRMVKELQCTNQFMEALLILLVKNIANPLAMILSFAMMLKYSFDMNEDSISH